MIDRNKGIETKRLRLRCQSRCRRIAGRIGEYAGVGRFHQKERGEVLLTNVSMRPDARAGFLCPDALRPHTPALSSGARPATLGPAPLARRPKPGECRVRPDRRVVGVHEDDLEPLLLPVL